MLKGFRDFILRGNTLDLAIAVVIGAAFNAVIMALVKDIITPIIAAAGRKPDFSGLFITLNGSRFMIGDFVNQIISLLIIAAVVYFLVMTPVNNLMTRLNKDTNKREQNRPCPECLSMIPKKAKRCRYCTAIVKK